MASTINTTFLQLVAAFFVAFVLAHMATKYFERFERFPSPLVSPGPGVPAMIQGRDFIPHRFKPTPPPGPAVPLAIESDPRAYETSPPKVPGASATPAASLPATTATPKLPYAMTNDDYLSFVTPEKSIAMSTSFPMP